MLFTIAVLLFVAVGLAVMTLHKEWEKLKKWRDEQNE